MRADGSYSVLQKVCRSAFLASNIVVLYGKHGPNSALAHQGQALGRLSGAVCCPEI